MTSSGTTCTFLDVLRELDLRALDVFYAQLLHTKALSATRLACRALRNAVDGSVRRVDIRITDTDWDDFVEERQPPSPLHLWPRCDSVHLDIGGAGIGLGVEAWPQVFPAWAFNHLPNGRLARISSLKLSTYNFYEVSPPALTSAIPLFTARLSALRELDLRDCHHEDWQHLSPASYRSMYAALAASCPQLQTLVVSNFTNLEGVGALSGSLTRLELRQGETAGDTVPVAPRGMAHAIGRLRSLRQLVLDGLQFDDESADTGGDFLLLLNSLPPSLVLLQLFESTISVSLGMFPTLAVRLLAGAIQSIEASGAIHSDYLMELAQVLLQCRALTSRLQEVHLDMLVVISRAHLEHPALQGLLHRCASVNVRSVVVWNTAVREATTRVAQLFGMPEALSLHGDGGSLDLRVRVTSLGERKEGEGESTASAAAGVASMAPGSSLPPGLRVAAAPATASEVPPAGAPATEHTEAEQICDDVLLEAPETLVELTAGRLRGQASDASCACRGHELLDLRRVVLLHGPFFGMLGTGYIVLHWLQNVEKEASAEVELAAQRCQLASAEASGGGGRHLPGSSAEIAAAADAVLVTRQAARIQSCLPLPRTATVLVQCNTAAAATLIGRLANRMSVSGGIQAHQLPYASLDAGLFSGMQPEVQRVWDRLRCSGISEQQKLKWLVGLWERVMDGKITVAQNA